MSLTIVAATVIGCEVTDKRYVEKTSRLCLHENPTTAVFCMTCGKPTALQVVRTPATWFADEGFEHKIIDLRVTGHDDGDRAFAGIVVSAREWSGERAKRSPIEDLQQARVLVRDVLEPRGLWDEKSFGIWTVLYVS